MAEDKKSKVIKVELKLRKRHPRKAFKLGKHVIEVQFKPFELSEADVKELSSVGCKHWIISKEELAKEKAPKEKAKK